MATVAETQNLDVKREEAAFRKYAAMRMAGEDTISVPKIYVDMTEDIEAAMILDEIIFWTLPKRRTGQTSLRVRKDGKLWLVVSRAEWWDRKRLSSRQSDRAIDKLIALGLVEKQVHRFGNSPQTHLRVIAPVFFELLIRKIQLEYEDANLEDGDMRKDIQDLYEMMGMKSTSPNGNLPNGDTTSPNGEIMTLPNGEIINSPKSVKQSLVGVSKKKKQKETPPNLTPEMIAIVESANKEVDFILKLQGLSAGKSWTNLPEIWHPYGKVFCAGTGITYTKGDLWKWQSAFETWQAKGHTPQAALDAIQCLKDEGKSGMISGPSSITWKMDAMVTERTARQQKQAQRQEETRPEIPEGWLKYYENVPTA